MSEPIKPKDPALAVSERNAKREKLWDQCMSLAQEFACDLRAPLQEDPWDHGKGYEPGDIEAWRERASRVSETMEQVFNGIDELLNQPCPEERKASAEARRAARAAQQRPMVKPPGKDPDEPPF